VSALDELVRLTNTNQINDKKKILFQMMFESRNRRISGLVYRKQQHLHLLFHYIADSHYKDELFLHYIGLSAKFSYICIIGAILGLFE